MKIIDKTPLQDEKGEIGIIGRVRGSIKYGFGWYAEMEAQKTLIAQLNRALEKSFVLIRNFNLPGSKLVIPIILIGTGSVYVIHPTASKGHFEAKGDQWNVIDNSGNSQPAKVNLIQQAVKLTRAFQKYLEINKIKITAPIETILVAVDSGSHIESVRPAIKVVKSDTIKGFIASLLQVPPVLRTDYIYELADKITEPRLREEESLPAPAAPEPEPISFGGFEDSSPAKPFDAGDFSAEFQEEESHEDQPLDPQVAPPRKPRRRPAPAKKIFGMTRSQAMIIAGFILFWLCALAGMAALILFYPQ